MPIKKENKHRYPPNWSEIRASVLERAGHKCEQCGLPNYAIVEKVSRRVVSGREAGLSGIHDTGRIDQGMQSTLRRMHWTRIVLTIAHLNHKPEDCDLSNLNALCQRCHNRYDQKHRAETRSEIKKGVSAADIKLMNKLSGWQLQMKLTEQEPEDA